MNRLGTVLAVAMAVTCCAWLPACACDCCGSSDPAFVRPSKRDPVGVERARLNLRTATQTADSASGQMGPKVAQASTGKSRCLALLKSVGPK